MVSNSTWPLQEAEARLSELVRRARTEGPQTITVDGEEAVVVLGCAEYERLHPRPASAGSGRSLLEVFRSSPIVEWGLSDEEIDAMFGRDRTDVGRDTVFDDD